MWICPNCGEPHQNQFKECWKCVGAAIESESSEHVTAEPPRPKAPPAPEPKLRSTGTILARAAVGFLIGVVLSLSSFNFINPQQLIQGEDFTLSPQGKTILALIVGAIFGIVVGLFFWVMFPYEPVRGQPDGGEKNSQPSNSVE